MSCQKMKSSIMSTSISRWIRQEPMVSGEWIGYIGVKSISGSFYNIMGLPIQKLYGELKSYSKDPESI